ncbi:MAG: Hsp70 family protein [Deltaproteobacteria bacterium]|nr:Hsp70 family protein [Deltaproteobacteria bacterium]
MPHAIGIDLGTSNSVVSVIRNGVAEVIPDAQGNRTHPSVVSFGHGQNPIVGHEAMLQMNLNPQGTVYSSKRLIGRTIDSEEVVRATHSVPYDIVPGEHHDPRIRVHDRVYSLQEISAHVLRYLRSLAEAYLDEPVRHAVITVPAYFNDNQRQATRDAGEIAGLEVLRIINEPTAAALAYGLGEERDEYAAVYDLGGGTFDISILRIMGDVFEVVSTAGDTYLGGDDFDQLVMDYMLAQLSEEHQRQVRRSPSARLKMRRAAEQAKRELSEVEETTIKVDALVKDERGYDQAFTSILTRIQYNQIVFPLVKRTFEVCDEALTAARCTPRDIGALVMVGGMTRSLIIQEAVENYFGREPALGVNPDEVVSVGAAIQAENLLGSMQSGGRSSGTLLIDVTPQSLGIATVAGFCERLIERNTSIPTGTSKKFTTSVDGQHEVKIEVFQGEARMASDNEKLGQFILEGLRPAPRGDVKITVYFDIDGDGIVSVTAEESETGQAASIRLEASTGLSADEVKDLREELSFDNLGF